MRRIFAEVSTNIPMKDFNNKLVLITGGSSGIGLALAKKLAALGANVYILARSADKLQIALAEITASAQNPAQTLGALQADVAQRKQVEEVLRQFAGEHGAPDLLVNSAGYSYPQTFLETPAEMFSDQMDVNYFGTVNVIRAILPGMLARKSGYIVNICSLAGLFSFYGYTSYSGSKYAVRGFTDGLRSELIHSGVRIALCYPPDTDTPGMAVENLTKPEVTRIASSVGTLEPPEKVADAIIKGIRRNKYKIMIGFTNRALYRVVHLLDSHAGLLIDAIVNSAIKQVQKNSLKK